MLSVHLPQTTYPPADRQDLTLCGMALMRNVVSPAPSRQGQRAVRRVYGVSGKG